MAKLILARHGQSIWNQLNLFTGWVDIALSQQGIEESFHIGQVISSLDIDVVYTSALVRAQMTALIAMTVHSSKKIPYLEPKANDPMQQWYQKGSNSQGLIPAYTAWELNERMYGDLQGKNKEEMMAEYGAEQVHQPDHARSSHTAGRSAGRPARMRPATEYCQDWRMSRST